VPRDSRISWTITRARRIRLIARESALETNSHWSTQHEGPTLFKTAGVLVSEQLRQNITAAAPTDRV
jgi:hypothetical protein